MRGNQEAYILVKVKDGRRFVCAINTAKSGKKKSPFAERHARVNLDRDIIWQ